MANLAFSQRIERAAVGALRARWASHRRQSRLDRSTYAVFTVRLGDSSSLARMRCSLPWTTLRSTLVTRPPWRVYEPSHNPDRRQRHARDFLAGRACLSASMGSQCETIHREPCRNGATRPRQTMADLDGGRSNPSTSAAHRPIRARRPKM